MSLSKENVREGLLEAVEMRFSHSMDGDISAGVRFKLNSVSQTSVRKTYIPLIKRQQEIMSSLSESYEKALYFSDQIDFHYIKKEINFYQKVYKTINKTIESYKKKSQSLKQLSNLRRLKAEISLQLAELQGQKEVLKVSLTGTTELKLQPMSSIYSSIKEKSSKEDLYLTFLKQKEKVLKYQARYQKNQKSNILNFIELKSDLKNNWERQDASIQYGIKLPFYRDNPADLQKQISLTEKIFDSRVKLRDYKRQKSQFFASLNGRLKTLARYGSRTKKQIAKMKKQALSSVSLHDYTDALKFEYEHFKSKIETERETLLSIIDIMKNIDIEDLKKSLFRKS